MAIRRPAQPERFDAFISYNRDDVVFAQWLETKLERYRPPKGIGSGRRLNVFRDVPDLIGDELSDAIVEAIGRSDHLIVVCPRSPDRSDWVNREIQSFASVHGGKHITPVILHAQVASDDAKVAENAFPSALMAIRADPLAADFRVIDRETRASRKARYREALFFVLARVLGVEKEALVRRQRRRTVRLVGAAIAGLVLLTIAFALIAVEAMNQRNVARDRARIATSRQLAAQALTSMDDQLDLGLLLSLQARHLDPGPDALGGLLAGLGRAPTLITYLRGHTGRVRDLAFDAEGGRLASASADSTIRIWDVGTGRQIVSLGGLQGVPLKLRITPDGRHLVSVGADSTIRVWDMGSHVQISSAAHGHPESATEVAISPHGDLVAVGGRFQLSFWDVDDGSPRGDPFRPEDHIITHSLDFSPDGSLLALGSGRGGSVRLLNVATRRELDPFRGLLATAISFSSDGRTLATGAGYVQVWDVKTRQQIGSDLVGHTMNMSGLAFGAEGRYLASVNGDETLRFWSIEEARTLGQALRGFGSSALAISPNGEFLAVGGGDGAISLWNAERWDLHLLHRLSRLLEYPRSVQSIAFSPDGSQLVTGGEDGTLQSWDVASGVPLEEPYPTIAPEASSKDIYAQVFDPSGRILALRHFGFVALWDFVTKEPLGRLPHGMHHIYALAFSPDGSILATNGWRDTIHLWDARTAERLQPAVAAQKGFVVSIAFTPNGKHMVSASAGGTLRLWNAETFEPIGQPREELGDGLVSVFVPDDNRLIAVGERSIYQLSLPDLDANRPWPMDQTLFVSSSSTAITEDGTRLALLREDGTIQLWDLEAQRPLREALPQGDVGMTGFPAWGRLAFSPNGRLLASRGAQQRIRIWDVDTNRWAQLSCGIVRRNLSMHEWDLYVGTSVPYCRACDEFPAGEGAPQEAPTCAVQRR